MKPASLLKFLAEPECTGVYHVPPLGHEALREAAGQLGFAFHDVQLAENEQLSAAFEALGRDLCFPDWYGRNFDALADCLGDFSWEEAPGYVLVLTGADAFRAADPGAFSTLNEVFSAVVEQWRDQGTPFWVFYDLRSNGLASLPTLA